MASVLVVSTATGYLVLALYHGVIALAVLTAFAVAAVVVTVVVWRRRTGARRPPEVRLRRHRS